MSSFESIALVGFGLDSAIEGFASVIIIWRFTDHRLFSDHAEERAQKLVAIGSDQPPRPARGAENMLCAYLEGSGEEFRDDRAGLVGPRDLEVEHVWGA
jgi:hypothetical protein